MLIQALLIILTRNAKKFNYYLAKVEPNLKIVFIYHYNEVFQNEHIDKIKIAAAVFISKSFFNIFWQFQLCLPTCLSICLHLCLQDGTVSLIA